MRLDRQTLKWVEELLSEEAQKAHMAPSQNFDPTSPHSQQSTAYLSGVARGLDNARSLIVQAAARHRSQD